MKIRQAILIAAGLCLALVAQAPAVSMEFVTVGDMGNAGELSGISAPGLGAYGVDRPNTGAVAYGYNIGKYEVTATQYTEFLSAVAGVADPYGLYNPLMVHKDPPTRGAYGDYAPHITRSGAEGSYTYAIDAGFENRPVNFVSTADAFRFANWMHNGKPSGVQDSTTTETGAYDLVGTHQYYEYLPEVYTYPDTIDWPYVARWYPGALATELNLRLNATLGAVTRETNAKYALPTEDEWYKAAYYDGNGSYYDFAMQTDDQSVVDLYIEDPDPGFNANYKPASGWDFTLVNHPGTYPSILGVPSDVGEFENSDSHYGTFDQSGNLGEYVHELIGINGDKILVRGGFFNAKIADITAASRFKQADPAMDWATYGFRLVSFVTEIPVGDMDGDGDVDGDDIDLMGDYIRTGNAPTAGNYDLSADGLIGGTDGNIDINDLDYLVRFLVETSAVDGGGNPIFGTQYGDFNLDGEIELGDLTRLGTYYGVGDTWAEGNANRYLDLLIELGDLTILGTYYGTDNGGVDTIPEPMTMGLLAVGACLPLFHRKTRHSLAMPRRK